MWLILGIFWWRYIYTNKMRGYQELESIILYLASVMRILVSVSANRFSYWLTCQFTYWLYSQEPQAEKRLLFLTKAWVASADSGQRHDPLRETETALIWHYSSRWTYSLKWYCFTASSMAHNTQILGFHNENKNKNNFELFY